MRARRGLPGVVLGASLVAVGNVAHGDIAARPTTVHAITGARVVVEPGADPISATIVIRDGIVEAVGPDIDIPSDARVHDREGRVIYAGFIEPYLSISIEEKAPVGPTPAGASRDSRDATPATTTAGPGPVHENRRVRSHVRAIEFLPIPRAVGEELRRAGYTAALSASSSGIFRGGAALVALVENDVASHVYLPEAAQVYAFEHGSWGDTSYPASLMGAIALTRQCFLDAEWLRRAEAAWAADPARVIRPEENLSLRALLPVLDRERPLFMECEDLRMIARAAAIADEFELKVVVVSGGSDEYRNPEWLAKTLNDVGAVLVVAVNFPPPPYWEHPDQASDVELDDLIQWERAPTGLGALASAGVRFSVTSQGLPTRGSIFERLQTSIELGLDRDVALAALTTEPARLFGLSDRLGTIATGKRANLTVCSDELFRDDGRPVEVWIDGVRYGDDPGRANEADVLGRWRIAFPEAPGAGRLSIKISRGEGELKATIEIPPDAGEQAGTEPGAEEIVLRDVRLTRDGALEFVIPSGAAGFPLDGHFTGRVRGDQAVGDLRVGEDVFAARALRLPEERKEKRLYEIGPSLSADAAPWPPIVTGREARTVHVRNATIWTCAAGGTMENADLIASDGLVVAVGPGLDAPAGALVVDGTGKHVTPGIIDCHSHAAISGDVNEGTHSCTAEVRVSDVIDPQSAATYRQLAGGVTVQNLLHGSANVIGGQNAVVKMRWGEPADALLFDGAPAGIKFALGENVKQSNWGDRFTTRYPQTRMGVEQFLRDRFLAALDHRTSHERWERERRGEVPRRDLELEALLEVIDGSRLIHCHAYRQDEILLLLRVMEEFGVRVATFQHALEAYKVADEIAAHGAGASIFSDWWAFKFEVYDAIPYNGVILRDRGVLTSLNSDSPELSRRLNLEAAKMIKYGGVADEEALKFVTLHPALQLGIDRWVGTLEPGKHADFVIWSDHPLSDRAMCLETWVDGVQRFSRARDFVARGEARALRDALLDKAKTMRDSFKQEPPFNPTFGAVYGASLEEAGLFLPKGACVAALDHDAALEER
jgi:imidazolonepropionase-like amidohydrolase